MRRYEGGKFKGNLYNLLVRVTMLKIFEYLDIEDIEVTFYNPWSFFRVDPRSSL